MSKFFSFLMFLFLCMIAFIFLAPYIKKNENSDAGSFFSDAINGIAGFVEDGIDKLTGAYDFKNGPVPMWPGSNFRDMSPLPEKKQPVIITGGGGSGGGGAF